MCRTSALLALGLSLPWMSMAEEPPSAVRVPLLITQLGSDCFAEREAASQALELLGELALPSLQQVLASSDLEVRRRAEELIGKIELRQQSTLLLRGKKLRLAYRAVPIQRAWVDFEKQAGLSLKLIGTEPSDWHARSVTLETDEISFWEALDRFSTALGLSIGTLFPDTTPPVLHLRPGSEPALPTCYAGALRVRAVPSDSPGWGRTPGVVDVPCLLEVAPEPSLAWQGVLDVRIHRAVDDRGQQLQAVPTSWETQALDNHVDLLLSGIPKFSSRDRLAGLPGQGQQVTVKLKLPPQPSCQLRELHGTLVGQVLTPLETQLCIDNLLLAAQQAFSGKDGSLFKIGQISRSREGIVQVEVEYEAPPAASAPLQAGLNNRRLANQLLIWQLKSAEKQTTLPPLEVQDARGRSLEVVRYNEANHFIGPRVRCTATLHLLPQPDRGEPARLLLLGRRSVIVETSFTLRDVPLP